MIIKYYEVSLADGYSIAIKGVRSVPKKGFEAR